MTEEIEALVEGGQASRGPPLGPALGPMGIEIGEVISEINEKTSDYEGMEVPVKVIVDEETKDFEIEVGSPPTSALIKNELGIEKGAGSRGEVPVGDLSISQLMKIADMKEGSTLGKNKKKRAKEVLGTCKSMGVYVEGKEPQELQREIEKGKHEDQLGK